jgi:hypothetical protein
MATGEMAGAMQCHDGLACPGGTGHTRRSRIVALLPLALFRMHEDRPLLPREIEGALQLLHIRDNAKPALGVWVVKRSWRRNGELGRAGLATGCKF